MLVALATQPLAAQTQQQLFDAGWQFTRNGKTFDVYGDLMEITVGEDYAG